MKPLAQDDKLHYFSFDSSSCPPLHVIERVIRDAWRIDYTNRNEAVFDYNTKYIDWLLRPESFEGIWAATPTEKPAGLMILTKRTICTCNGTVPAYYGSMLSVVREFRGHNVGKRMFELACSKMSSRALFGVMDGNHGGMQVSKGFIKSQEKDKANPFFSFLSKPYTIWIAFKDAKILHSYIPLPAGLQNSLARKVMEFNFKEPEHLDYRVSFAEHLNQSHFVGGTWSENSELELLYCIQKYKEIAGTYKVKFNNSEACCYISYSMHKVVKEGLPGATAGHLQLIRDFEASSAQVRRSIRVVTNELIKSGAIAVLVHHTYTVDTRNLLQAGFLPSGRKITYYFGWHASTAPPCKLENPIYFDLL